MKQQALEQIKSRGPHNVFFSLSIVIIPTVTLPCTET
jgi:hypothetical protein